MFSMISDPAYVARANAAFDSAWDAIKLTVEAGSPGERDAQLRLRLFIESYSLVADSERDLTNRAVDRFRKNRVESLWPERAERATDLVAKKQQKGSSLNRV